MDLHAQAEAVGLAPDEVELFDGAGPLDTRQPDADDRRIRGLDERERRLELGRAEVADRVDDDRDTHVGAPGRESCREARPELVWFEAHTDVTQRGHHDLGVDDALGCLTEGERRSDRLHVVPRADEVVDGHERVEEVREVRIRRGIATILQRQDRVGVEPVATCELDGGRFGDAAAQMDVELDLGDREDVVLGRGSGHGASIDAGSFHAGGLRIPGLPIYITAGSIAAAAYELGISETTARQHLSGLYRRTGCLNAAHAAYWLGTSERNIA